MIRVKKDRRCRRISTKRSWEWGGGEKRKEKKERKRIEIIK